MSRSYVSSLDHDGPPAKRFKRDESLPSTSTAKPKVPTFEVTILGGSKVGKNTYKTNYWTGPPGSVPDPRNPHTTVPPYRVRTTKGDVDLAFWGLPYTAEYKSVLGDVFVIMFDFTSVYSYNAAVEWYETAQLANPTIPVILVANKYDLKERVVKPHMIKLHKTAKLPYFEISAKEKLNLGDLLREIVRVCMKDNTIEILPNPWKPPPLDQALNCDWSEIIRRIKEQEAGPRPLTPIRGGTSRFQQMAITVKWYFTKNKVHPVKYPFQL